MNNDENQLIKKMYENNVGIRKIAGILNIPLKNVYEVLREEDIFFSKDKYVERNNRISQLYSNERKKISEIASILSIDRHTVTQVLKDLGIYNGNIRASNLSLEKEERNQKIIALYESGNSCRTVAKKLAICPSTVSNVLRDFNKNVRQPNEKGHSKGTTKNRKYTFDYDFFEKIDNEKKAYWLGFLMADGSVSDRGAITLALAEKDYLMLEKLKNAVNGNMPIKHRESKIKKKTYKICRIVLSSVKMAEDLIKKGCVPRKTFQLKFPSSEDVSRGYIHHFMRGYFDGDGCMGINGQFSIVSNRDFVKEYERILLSFLPTKRIPVKLVPTKNNDQICNIVHGGRKIIKEIYDFLYKDATIYMERKRDNFLKFLGVSA